eukprot:scaffold12393_cov105-Isochrysis_galbana.AAC.5
MSERESTPHDRPCTFRMCPFKHRFCSGIRMAGRVDRSPGRSFTCAGAGTGSAVSARWLLRPILAPHAYPAHRDRTQNAAVCIDRLRASAGGGQSQLNSSAL